MFFSIGYIEHNKDVFNKFLGRSLRQLSGSFELISTSDEKKPAENYNIIINNAQSDYLILTHQDVSFSSTLLQDIERTLKQIEYNFGVLGMVGVNASSEYKWSRENEIFKLETTDSCFIVIDKKDNIYFNSRIFDDYHLYVEDYCAVVSRIYHRPIYTILTNSKETPPSIVDESKERYLNHHSVTMNKRGAAWGRYPEYRKLLEKRWPGIKTT